MDVFYKKKYMNIIINWNLKKPFTKCTQLHMISELEMAKIKT